MTNSQTAKLSFFDLFVQKVKDVFPKNQMAREEIPTLDNDEDDYSDELDDYLDELNDLMDY